MKARFEQRQETARKRKLRIYTKRRRDWSESKRLANPTFREALISRYTQQRLNSMSYSGGLFLRLALALEEE